MARASGIPAWQPIATAPEGETVIVCRTRAGGVFVVALAKRHGSEWTYPDRDGPLGFAPEYWVDGGVRGNPFHLPLPGPAA